MDKKLNRMKLNKGKMICEGKTKAIFELVDNPNMVLIESKDKITAGDGEKSHDMKDKAEFSTRTNAAIFKFLNAAGVPTSFVESVEGNNKAFIAKRCEMVPIEWVTRRIATGSFLRRHPNVKEGYRFAPVKLETFFKDDANHDPFWSLESIKAADFPNLPKLTEYHVERMAVMTQLIFELLERAWQTLNHSLVDMKIEFGFDMETNEVILSDVIDNDSWRLWPNGDKRLMLDKQVYRNLDVGSIDREAMEKVRQNFLLVAERTEELFKTLIPKPMNTMPKSQLVMPPQVGIIMGSSRDAKFCETILDDLKKMGIERVEVHITSAHKSTKHTLEVVGKLNQWDTCKCIIAVAGRSNGLGLVAAANSIIPVINCPPLDMSTASIDIWSSLRTPTGMSCATVMGAECGAMAAAQMVANDNCFIWSTLKTRQTMAKLKIIEEDTGLSNLHA